MEGQGGLVTSHRGPEDRDGEGGNDSLLCRMQERRGERERKMSAQTENIGQACSCALIKRLEAQKHC